eukprot:1640142-Pyramimonas_sp.AAC.1
MVGQQNIYSQLIKGDENDEELLNAPKPQKVLLFAQGQTLRAGEDPEYQDRGRGVPLEATVQSL